MNEPNKTISITLLIKLLQLKLTVLYDEFPPNVILYVNQWTKRFYWTVGNSVFGVDYRNQNPTITLACTIKLLDKDLYSLLPVSKVSPPSMKSGFHKVVILVHSWLNTSTRRSLPNPLQPCKTVRKSSRCSEPLSAFEGSKSLILSSALPWAGEVMMILHLPKKNPLQS